MYHEQQSRQMCLKHTLNNVFQREVFSAVELDRIASGLEPRLGTLHLLLSQHATPWLGNYSVSVLEVALASQQKACLASLRSSVQPGQPTCGASSCRTTATWF